MASGTAGAIRLESAFVRNVSPSKDGKTTYIDFVGKFGELSVRAGADMLKEMVSHEGAVLPVVVLAVTFRQFAGAARADGKFSPNQLTVNVEGINIESGVPIPEKAK